jgi:hypothetical protein
VPRHPSFLLKIKIIILDFFSISLFLYPFFSHSLSLSLTSEECASIKHARTLSVPHSFIQSVLCDSLPLSHSLSLPLYPSISLSLSLSPSLTGEEGVRTLASIKHARTINKQEGQEIMVSQGIPWSLSHCRALSIDGIEIIVVYYDLYGTPAHTHWHACTFCLRVARALSVPHSVSQSACVIIILIWLRLSTTVSVSFPPSFV